MSKQQSFEKNSFLKALLSFSQLDFFSKGAENTNFFFSFFLTSW